LPREKIFGIITIRNLKEEFFMVTNNLKVVCPKCGSANCYSLTSLKMYDNDLHATYSCDVCETEFTNVYTLVYLGGHTSVYEYDRDNIFISAKGTVATVGL
jgi:transposase-like protein